MLHGATGGYLAFEEGLLSNHHGLWIDLQMEVVFGNRDRFSTISTAWRLKCQDPRVVARYNQWLVAEIRTQGLDEQVCKLEKDGHSVTMAAVDRIDRKLTQAKL